MFDDIALVRALHVLALIHWIGGVAFVTLIVLPLARPRATGSRCWRFSSRQSSDYHRRSAFRFLSRAQPDCG